jgi:hypothetical protein
MTEQELLIAIAVNLVSALIGFGGGRTFQLTRSHLRLRKARRFWKDFAAERSHVIIGRFHEFDGFEPSGLIGVGDAAALGELEGFFDRLQFPRLSLGNSGDATGNDLKQNLVLLGGPDANEISKQVAEKIPSTIRFGNPLRHEISMFDSQSGRVFTPKQTSDGQRVSLDYGLIYKVPNPFSPDYSLVLVAGSFGYGTWAGIQYITSPAFLDDHSIESTPYFELLIETDVILGVPQAIRRIAFRELSAPTD